jgi:hypothetical protein
VDPREDNALAITTDGRKLALDARMHEAGAPDHSGSKVNALVDNVFAIWQRTADKRSAQMVFCDMGVHPTPWGFSAYEEVIQKLVERGIPRQQIAAIGDADSDAKKQVLFEKVRRGSIRVLLGSTQKMGTGTNVQKRLVALHHLDAPWKPAEVEQREGRILRQGNENDEVAIYRYVTTGSFDSYMWQALETKAKFIAQIMSGESGVRCAEDIGGQELSYAEVKAIASGNPAVLTLAEADAELQRLLLLKKNHADEQYLARRSLKDLPGTIARLSERLTGLTDDMETAKAHEHYRTIIGSRKCSGEEVLAVLGKQLDALPQHASDTRHIPLGIYRGLRFGLVLHPQLTPDVYLQGAAVRQSGFLSESHGPRAVLNAIERLAGAYGTDCARVRQDLGIAEGQLRDYQVRLGTPFEHESYLAELTALRNQLKTALSGAPTEPEAEQQPTASELAERIKSLTATRTIEASPRRSGNRRAAAEQPVTARIRPRTEVTPDAAARPSELDTAHSTAPQTSSWSVHVTFQERTVKQRKGQDQEPSLA